VWVEKMPNNDLNEYRKLPTDHMQGNDQDYKIIKHLINLPNKTIENPTTAKNIKKRIRQSLSAHGLDRTDQEYVDHLYKLIVQAAARRHEAQLRSDKTNNIDPLLKNREQRINHNTKQKSAQNYHMIRQARKDYIIELINQTKMCPIFSHWSTDDQSIVLFAFENGGATVGKQQGALATLSAIETAVKERDWDVIHVSNNHGIKDSCYIKVPGGDIVRVSNHELPITHERLHHHDQNNGPTWAGEIIVDDWLHRSIESYMSEIRDISLHEFS